MRLGLVWPSLFLDIKAEVSKFLPCFTPNWEHVADLGTFRKSPLPWASWHPGHPVLEKGKIQLMFHAPRHDPGGDVERPR